MKCFHRLLGARDQDAWNPPVLALIFWNSFLLSDDARRGQCGAGGRSTALGLKPPVRRFMPPIATSPARIRTLGSSLVLRWFVASRPFHKVAQKRQTLMSTHDSFSATVT
jgi:hypothetical protein